MSPSSVDFANTASSCNAATTPTAGAAPTTTTAISRTTALTFAVLVAVAWSLWRRRFFKVKLPSRTAAARTTAAALTFAVLVAAAAVHVAKSRRFQAATPERQLHHQSASESMVWGRRKRPSFLVHPRAVTPAPQPAAGAPSLALPVASVSFAAACEELRARALQVREARRGLQRARNEVNILRRAYRVQLKQAVPKPLLQKAVKGRATSKQGLVEKLRALDESVLVVENCDPKPSDWKKQVAAALVRPSE
jgi:hypothetical protein